MSKFEVFTNNFPTRFNSSTKNSKFIKSIQFNRTFLEYSWEEELVIFNYAILINYKRK